MTKKLEIKRLPSDVLFVSFTESNYDETKKKIGKFKIILDFNLNFWKYLLKFSQF